MSERSGLPTSSSRLGQAHPNTVKNRFGWVDTDLDRPALARTKESGSMRVLCGVKLMSAHPQPSESCQLLAQLALPGTFSIHISPFITSSGVRVLEQELGPLFLLALACSTRMHVPRLACRLLFRRCTKSCGQVAKVCQLRPTRSLGYSLLDCRQVVQTL